MAVCTITDSFTWDWPCFSLTTSVSIGSETDRDSSWLSSSMVTVTEKLSSSLIDPSATLILAVSLTVVGLGL